MQKNKINKIAIFGGSGFVGSSLRKIFNSSNISHINFDLNSKNVKNDYFCDVSNYESLKDLDLSECTSIVNLAAEHRDDVKPISKYDEVNVVGAINVCKIAKEHNINQIIFTSSVAVYGFAPKGTDENGDFNYFNDYGRTKYEAEKIYLNWFHEDPCNRKLVIIRPTVIFGKGNRGNVYNLFSQIANKKFVMVGNGKNIKSMAYVENVASFIQHSLNFPFGKHIYNYIDKPDMDMNSLVKITRKILFKKNNVGLRLPSFLGVCVGYFFDFLAYILKRNLPISSIRIQKFLNDSQFNSAIDKSGFVPPVGLRKALESTIIYEFSHQEEKND